MNTKQFFTCIILTLIITNLFPSSYITYYNSFSQNIDNENSSDIIPYAEQTKWYYRVVDGKTQKRLWSLTHRKWLTDWIWV